MQLIVTQMPLLNSNVEDLLKYGNPTVGQS